MHHEVQRILSNAFDVTIEKKMSCTIKKRFIPILKDAIVFIYLT